MAEPERITALEVSKDKVQREIDIARGLEKDSGARLSHYDELEQTYAGVFSVRKHQGVWEKTFARILPWYSDQNKLRPVVSVNYARQIVRARRAQIGVLPQVRCTPKGYAGETEEPEDIEVAEALTAAEHAELREHIIWHGWRDSLMGKRMGDAGFFASLYGTAVSQLRPDYRNKSARYLTRSPSGCYPICTDDDGLEVSRCYFINQMSARTANEKWPGKGLDRYGGAPLDIIEIYTDEYSLQACEEANGYLLAGETNPAEFVPIQLIPNSAVPGSMWGDSDLEDIIELQREYNRRLALETEMILRTLYAPLVIVNPTAVPKRIPYGPGAHITVHQGGDVRPVQMASLSYNWAEGYQRIEKLIEDASDMLPQQRGQMDSAIVTGKAFVQSQGPNINRIELANQYIHPAVARQSSNYLRLMEKLFSGQKLSFNGNRKNSPYAFTFDPAQIDGVYDCEVYMDAASFFDQNTRWILGMQAVAQGVLSKQRFMTFFPWVDDAPAELKQIRSERQEDMQDAAMANAIAQGLQPPDVGEVPGSVQNLAQGTASLPEAPFPGGREVDVDEMLSNMEIPGAPTGQGEPQEVTRVAELIRRCENLRGRVWLVGEFLQSGNVDNPAGIEVVLQVFADKSALQNHLRRADPDNYGLYTFLPLEEGLTEPRQHSLEVTPPGVVGGIGGPEGAQELASVGVGGGGEGGGGQEIGL